MATTLRAGRSGVRIPVEKVDISLCRNVQIGYGAPPPPPSKGTGLFAQGEAAPA